MAGELILVTGATGHLGYRTVVLALEAGYKVRAAVRSQAKAETILTAPSIQTLAPSSKLDFVIVPDILADGAYNDAVKDVKAILHIASPLAAKTEDYERDVISPAIKGTTNILNAAAKEPSVKRVVITSSLVAVVPWAEAIIGETTHVYTADKGTPDPSGPYEQPFEAYAAAKTKALNATKNFVKTEKPTFDVINVMPGFFVGKNELITDAKDILSGTNAVAFASILGHVSDRANPGSVQHVDDVAKVHVLSLDSKVEGNQDFGIQAGGTDGIVWDDALEIVERRFPEAVKDGRLPLNGAQPTKKIRYDASRTEKVLGIKFQSLKRASGMLDRKDLFASQFIFETSCGFCETCQSSGRHEWNRKSGRRRSSRLMLCWKSSTFSYLESESREMDRQGSRAAEINLLRRGRKSNERPVEILFDSSKFTAW